MIGLVRFFLDSKVAANLLALFLVGVGVLAGGSLVVRLFPETNLYAVQVAVPYPGASPEEVEEGIVEPIEERIEGLKGVRKTSAVAAENIGTVVVFLNDGEDVEARMNDIRTAISQITVFPAAAEQPQVSELESDEVIAQIILSGNIDAIALKRLAQGSRTRLSGYEPISRAEIVGLPDYLIDIAISEARLQSLGLSLPQLAGIIRSESLELSGGEIEGESRRSLVRTLGENETGEEFEEIIVARSVKGSPVRLSEIASVSDGLAEAPLDASLNGQQAVAILVFRVGNERVFDIIEAVRDELDYLENVLPAGVEATLWRDQSADLQGRINLLVRNAIMGLSLVTILLLLFLDVRIAFWVAIGVAISFFGSLILMSLFGIGISQLSLFGFILAIGIVVDDAIVVGENIYSETEKGFYGRVAARRGVARVIKPVVFSVSTTIVAFLPLIFLPGVFGQFLAAISAVVIFVLFMSLVDSFFILPKHLSHLSNSEPGRISVRRYVEPLRHWTADRLGEFSENFLRPAIKKAVFYPAVTLMCATGLLIATFGLFSSGAVKFVFFPGIEGNFLTAELELAEAASETQTREALGQIVEAADRAAQSIAGEFNTSSDEVLTGVFWTLGARLAEGGPGDIGATSSAASNKAFITLKMQDASERRFTADQFEREWRRETGEIAGAQTLSFSADLTGVEAAVTIKIAGENQTARNVVARLREEIEKTPGSLSVRDDRFRTTEEVQIELLPAARALGVTLEQVATQIRAAYFGAEAVRILRDREEIQVRVRLTNAERSSIDTIKNQRIAANGVFIPISQIARVTVGEAPSVINRQNGQRVYTLRSDVDYTITTGGAIASRVFNEVWPSIQDEYPGVSVGEGGDQEEQTRTQGALQVNFMIALFAIYALLALAFGSYTQPLVIMCAIPFGLIGAFFGHALLGINLTLLSMFGIIGLSGVIINDALLMVDFINSAIEDGADREDAVIDSAVGRFRPIILTSLTTFLGVTPIILERSVQAAFLVPTAVSLGFGILFGTVVLMMVVPAAAVLHLRSRAGIERFFTRHFKRSPYEDDEAEQSARLYGAKSSAR